MAFTTPVDVANRALQHLGVPRITAFTDSSKQAKEIGFNFDKLRSVELQRSVWTFAIRHAILRAVVSTTDVITFATYAVGTTYAVGDIVKDSAGYLWLSTTASNVGNTPGAGGVNPFWIAYFGPTVAQAWVTATAYYPGDIIYTSSVVYICVLPNNTQTQPNATYWHVIQGATIAASTFTTLSPIGYKPDGSAVRLIYRLPANFLRMAAQDPKNPAGVQLNVTAAMRYNDWEIEAGYLMTNDTAPIILRFVADQTDVTTMHPLFCEVWAARMAVDLCETITQSNDKLASAERQYTRYLNMAKMNNSIEGGSSEDEQIEAPPQQQRGQ